MVENPRSCVDQIQSPKDSKTRVTRRNRYPVDDPGDLIECSGEYCSSCTASFMADCIAVCCCPCAIVNLLVLAFVKLPWMMGKRCLRLLNKKRRMLEKKKREKSREKDVVVERGGAVLEEKEEELEIPIEGVVDGENFCARVEAERVWLELYQVGHLGFGRVSFTGIPEKGN